MSVLSGGTPPATNEFLATSRRGQGSSYRIAYVAKPPAGTVGASPRALAEPLLAALAHEVLAGFGRCHITISISVPDPEPPASETVRVSLAGDLGMEPIDLLLSCRR